MRIIAYPRAGIAYTECFYAALRGVEVIDGVWAGRWILANVRRRDVVHIHWPSFHYAKGLAKFFVFLLFMRLRGARIIWTAHNLYPHDGGRTRQHRLARLFLTRIASAVLVHGAAALEIVATEFRVPRLKLLRIDHGHFIDYYPHTMSRKDARERLGIPAGRFVFGLVGLCKPYKNLDALLEAFVQVRGDVGILIAGKFQSQQYFERISSKLNTLDRVTFRPGFIQDVDIQLYIEAIDAMVIPYTEILTSGSAMLALSFGRPVIAPDRGNLRALVPPSCGILYDESGGLLQAMRLAPSRAFDAQVIREHAKRFNWEASAARFVDALRPDAISRRELVDG